MTAENVMTPASGPVPCAAAAPAAGPAAWLPSAVESGPCEQLCQEALAISVRRHSPEAPVIERGEGCHLFDQEGRAYLDMSAGSGAVNLGHQRREIVEAIQRQAERLIHTGWTFDHPLRHEVIAKLGPFLPYPTVSVMGAVSGAEAIEVALKIARAQTGRSSILYFESSFHGKTQGALAVTSNRLFRAHLPAAVAAYPSFPLARYREGGAVDAGGFAADLTTLLTSLRRRGSLPAAAVIEPVQAAEGIYEVPRAILAVLVEVCRQLGVVSIFDEIYTGLGRTGTPFVADVSLRPDLLVIGKALGNGMPISAVAGEPALVDRLGFGEHSSTFTFMPLACAAASRVLDLHAAERPWENATVAGALLRRGVEEVARRDGRVGPVRGRGLMLAFDAEGGAGSGERLASRLARRLGRHGVLVRTGGRTGNTIKLTPPLTFTAAEVAEFLGALERSLAEL